MPQEGATVSRPVQEVGGQCLAQSSGGGQSGVSLTQPSSSLWAKSPNEGTEEDGHVCGFPMC